MITAVSRMHPYFSDHQTKKRKGKRLGQEKCEMEKKTQRIRSSVDLCHSPFPALGKDGMSRSRISAPPFPQGHLPFPIIAPLLTKKTILESGKNIEWNQKEN